MYETKPWLARYGTTPATLNYPESSMCGALEQAARKDPAAIALRFLGTSIHFDNLQERVVRTSRALAAAGFRPGERVLVCLPNMPQAVILLYALNRLGAVPAMIHPLSAAHEIATYAQVASCTKAIFLNAFYERFAGLINQNAFEKVLICRIDDFLWPHMALGFWLGKGRKIKPVPWHPCHLSWAELHKLSRTARELPAPDPQSPHDMAVILFSGGTTGEPKGIMLSNLNFNALAFQTEATGGPIGDGDAMLSILPVFHGFGLAVGIHTMLINGGTCILVPTFTPATVAGLIRRWRPQFVAGVPTLFDALAANPVFKATNLACFKGIFCGGDSLSREIKERFEAVLRANGCQLNLREGYGLTESVTANMLMPRQEYREHSIGVPYPDMVAKVVNADTLEELPPGTEGEICVRGPTVMLGYLDHPEETARVLRRHADGQLWLHTGDSGTMDTDGFFYFRQRLKRIIKTSGISVYPSQIEETLSKHPAIRMACVIGVPHPTQVQVPRAYVVLNEGHAPTDSLRQELIDHCRAELMSYACPREVEFRDSLPLTLVGKIAYRELEKDAAAGV